MQNISSLYLQSPPTTICSKPVAAFVLRCVGGQHFSPLFQAVHAVKRLAILKGTSPRSSDYVIHRKIPGGRLNLEIRKTPSDEIALGDRNVCLVTSKQSIYGMVKNCPKSSTHSPNNERIAQEEESKSVDSLQIIEQNAS